MKTFRYMKLERALIKNVKGGNDNLQIDSLEMFLLNSITFSVSID